MQDQTLKCKDCGASFVWTAGEQEFYKQKGFTNSPTRCPACRQNKKAQMSSGPRQDYPIVCSKCGKNDTVPFAPKGDKPVLCRDCFKSARSR